MVNVGKNFVILTLAVERIRKPRNLSVQEKLFTKEAAAQEKF